MFDIDSIKSLEDTQKSNFYRAKVISLADPLALGRIQIKIFGLTDDVGFPDESQPWCEFQYRDGVITYPNENDIIWLFFEGGDIFRPVYLGTIYAGIDASCDAGWEQFLEYRNIAVEDLEKHKINMKRVNNIEDPDSRLIIKDAFQQFNNFMLVEDDIPFQVFDGDDTEGEKIYHKQRDGEIGAKGNDIPGSEQVTEFEGYGIDWGHYRYWPRIPKGWAGQRMYVWYKQRELQEGETWRNNVGGWTYYTKEQIQDAMATFPDNLRHFNYNRFQKWKKNVEGIRFEKGKGFIPEWEQPLTTVQQQWMWESSNPDNTVQGSPASGPPFLHWMPHTWEFIPDYPWHFWQPEKTCDTGLWYSYLVSFPFGKMNLDNRKYWKQHTIMSHDSKSAIELDDNDNYERLALIFDHGSGGIEFSHAGMNGLDIWTDGIFHLHAGSKTLGNNSGPKEHHMFFPGGSFQVTAESSTYWEVVRQQFTPQAVLIWLEN